MRKIMKGYMTLTHLGILNGFSEADLGTAKPEHIFLKAKYKKWWHFDSRERIRLMQILIEAIDLGLDPLEQEYWQGPKAWNIQEADCLVFASRAGITLEYSKETKKCFASYLPPNGDIGYKSAGPDYWAAICNVWKLIMETKRSIPEKKDQKNG